LRNAEEEKALIDEELHPYTASSPVRKPAKGDMDEFETKMNVSVMNTEGYNQKITVVTSELAIKRNLLERSMVTLVKKSNAFNLLAQRVFQSKNGESKIELVKAFKEFEEVFISIGIYNSHCKFLEKDVDYLSKAMINSQK